MLSKFYHAIPVDSNKYAIYNSLLMNIIFVDEEIKNKIENKKINNKEEVKILYENGIYVKDESVDDRAFKNITDMIYSHSSKISIMYLNISTFCNLACKYCFIDNNPISTSKCSTMEFKTAKIAVDKFVKELEKNNEKDGQIIIYGGEPLTNWELLCEIVKYVKTKKINIKLTTITNGTLLTKDKMLFLKENKVGIGVSLDGPKDINDTNRIFKNSNGSVYDAVADKIKLLNKLECEYCISSTATPKVVEDKEKIITWLKELKVKNVFWNLYHYSTYDENWKEFYEKMSDFILDIYSELDHININEERVMEQIDLFLDKNFKYHNCGAVGLNQITVQPNGNICICQGDSRANSTLVGNIIEDEIKDIVNKAKSQDWTKMYTVQKEKCKNCEALFICGGGCPLQAEALFGDRKELDLATCIYYKKSIEWLLKKYYNSLREEEPIEKGGEEYVNS
ncbi:MAG: radical SAM protein [Bacilli bacterium]|nr:radical SAM protein [Bacilli bacterium]